ncbi:MAG: porin [Microscillaceae bacterium]
MAECALAQDSSRTQAFTFSAYLETYFTFDFQKPVSGRRPAFLYNHTQHNEVNLNLGILQAQYEGRGYRATLGLMVGTYAQENLAAEPSLLQFVYAAHAGLRLHKKADFWLDMGILPSHIGFESARGQDCWTLSRSLLAENSPYYEAGARLSYTSPGQRWYLAALYLNGWQRIRRPPGNQSPAFGTQVSFRAQEGLLLNWSTFVGNDQPDSLRQWRIFQNFYGQWQLSEKWGLLLGFDWGQQQRAKGEGRYHHWWSPVCIVRFQPSPKISLAARGEYYHDPQEVIVRTQNAQGFQTLGYSLNLDFAPRPNVLWRIEGRGLGSKHRIFGEENALQTTNLSLSTSLSVAF